MLFRKRLFITTKYKYNKIIPVLLWGKSETGEMNFLFVLTLTYILQTLYKKKYRRQKTQ